MELDFKREAGSHAQYFGGAMNFYIHTPYPNIVKRYGGDLVVEPQEILNSLIGHRVYHFLDIGFQDAVSVARERAKRKEPSSNDLMEPGPWHGPFSQEKICADDFERRSFEEAKAGIEEVIEENFDGVHHDSKDRILSKVGTFMNQYSPALDLLFELSLEPSDEDYQPEFSLIFEEFAEWIAISRVHNSVDLVVFACS